MFGFLLFVTSTNRTIVNSRVKLVVFFLLLAINQAFAQSQSLRIKVTSGNNLEFNFNSYSKLKNGIQYDDFTTIKVSFSDVDEHGAYTSTGWRLSVNASSDDLIPDFGTRHLPLSIIEMKFVHNSEVKQYPLAKAVTIVDDVHQNPTNDYTYKVSYSCGMNEELMNVTSDYFSTDIMFTVTVLE